MRGTAPLREAAVPERLGPRACSARRAGSQTRSLACGTDGELLFRLVHRRARADRATRAGYRRAPRVQSRDARAFVIRTAGWFAQRDGRLEELGPVRGGVRATGRFPLHLQRCCTAVRHRAAALRHVVENARERSPRALGEPGRKGDRGGRPGRRSGGERTADHRTEKVARLAGPRNWPRMFVDWRLRSDGANETPLETPRRVRERPDRASATLVSWSPALRSARFRARSRPLATSPTCA